MCDYIVSKVCLIFCPCHLHTCRDVERILETLSLYKMKYTRHRLWSQSWNKQQFQLWFYSPLISDCIKMCRWLYESCTWWSSTKMEQQEWNIKCQYSSFVLLPLIIKSVLTAVGELCDKIKILTNFISCSEWMLRLAGWIKAYFDLNRSITIIFYSYLTPHWTEWRQK